jgi:DNA-binding CsgD family transcriptional regulator
MDQNRERAAAAVGGATTHTLFGIDDVVVDPEMAASTAFAAPDAPLGSLAHKLAAAADSAARRATIDTALQHAGFDSLCYVRMLRVGEQVTQVAWLDSYSPPGWAGLYCRENFFLVDPRVTTACQVEWPFTWDMDRLSEAADTVQNAAATRRLADAAIAAGVRSGVCVGIATANQFERCIVMLSSAKPADGWTAGTTVGIAYALAAGIHTLVDPYASGLLPRYHADDLTDTQRAVLLALAQGKNDREIASHLALSSQCVSQHVRELQARYRAQNRVQLAYVAGGILRES